MYVLVNKYMYYIINTYIHETNTCMTIHVLGQYLKYYTCIVLQYMYCATSPQCVPSLSDTHRLRSSLQFHYINNQSLL